MSDKPLILITGTRSGLGRSLAERFIKENFFVVGCSRNNSDLIDDHYVHIEADIAQEKSVKNIFRLIRKEYGTIDCVINNAGIASMNHALLTSELEARKVFDTNFFGTFLVSREAVKSMRKVNSGRIINISSIHTKFDIEGTSIYGSSKAAVEQFTKVLAKEIESSGITANVLSLSVVENTGMSEAINPEIFNEILSKSSSNSVVSIDDIFMKIKYLFSENSQSVNGQIIQLG